VTADGVLVRPPSAGESVRSVAHGAHRARRQRPRVSDSARAVAVLVVVLMAATVVVVHTTAGLLRDEPPATYALADAPHQWLQAGTPGSTAWFRRDLALGERPATASITVDGTDNVRAWVNGRSEVARKALPPDAAEVALTADIAPDLRVGANSLLIEVTSIRGGRPQLWASLSLVLDDGTRQDIGPESAGWQATTDPAAAGVRLGMKPGAAQPADDSASPLLWPDAVPSPTPRDVRTSIPPDVIALARGSSAASTAAPAATISGRMRGSGDAWLRISASARASVSVDGRLAADLPAPDYVSPNSSRPGSLTLVHLGRVTAGSRLAVRLTGSRPSVLYADLVVPDGGGWTVRALPAAALVAVDSQGATSAMGAVDVTTPWPNRWRVDDEPIVRPVSAGLGWQLLIAGFAVLLLVGAAFAVAHTRRIGRRRALTLVVAGSLPGVAGCVAYLAWQRWASHMPGSGRAGWAVAIAALWIAGVAVATLGVPKLPILSRRIGAVVTPRRLIYATALLGGIWVLSGIGHQPLWQDEATSLQVARDINAHGLPRLGSDLIYFKAELYHVLLAVLIHISDNVLFLRLISDLWFVGSVIVFGRVLMPVLAPGRPWLHVAATAAFTVLPAERVWADQLRMYQQMQFFSILFLAFLLRALTTGRTRDIRWAAALLLLTYFSHEESFILLPGVAVLALVRWRAVFAALREFALAFVPAGVLIVAQYLVAQGHPPIFGTDLSNRPYVGLDFDQITYYYDTVFFAPIGVGPSLAIVSTLALIGVVAGVRRRDGVVVGAGIIVAASALTASLLFTAKVARYTFVLLPPLIALAVLGAVAVWSLAGRLLHRAAGVGGVSRGRAGTRRGVLVVGLATAALLCVATAATTAMSAGQLTRPGSFHPDYGATVGYLDAHRAPGDVTVTLAAPVMTSQYAHRSPDRVVQTGANKLLYVTLKDGRAVETILGVPVLLTGDDVRRYVSAHPRVWLVSDNGGYLANVPADVREAITSQFHVVYQNGSTTLSLAGYAA
jgi:hypothetical protein